MIAATPKMVLHAISSSSRGERQHDDKNGKKYDNLNRELQPNLTMGSDEKIP